MKWLICNRCGAECGVRGPDSIDWCDECGVVEGNTHIEEYTYDDGENSQEFTNWTDNVGDR